MWDISTSTARVIASASIPAAAADSGDPTATTTTSPEAAAGVAPSCIAWRPGGNALAVVDEAGRLAVWESPVPADMRLPAEIAAEAAGGTQPAASEGGGWVSVHTSVGCGRVGGSRAGRYESTSRGGSGGSRGHTACSIRGR